MTQKLFKNDWKSSISISVFCKSYLSSPLLGENKVVPVDLAKKMAPLAGLRNILVHDYLEIDLKRIYEFLRNDLSDFSEFGKYISRYVFGKEE